MVIPLAKTKASSSRLAFTEAEGITVFLCLAAAAKDQNK